MRIVWVGEIALWWQIYLHGQNNIIMMLIQMYGASQLCLPDVEIPADKLDDIQCLRNTYKKSPTWRNRRQELSWCDAWICWQWHQRILKGCHKTGHYITTCNPLLSASHTALKPQLLTKGKFNNAFPSTNPEGKKLPLQSCFNYFMSPLDHWMWILFLLTW